MIRRIIVGGMSLVAGAGCGDSTEDIPLPHPTELVVSGEPLPEDTPRLVPIEDDGNAGRSEPTDPPDLESEVRAALQGFDLELDSILLDEDRTTRVRAKRSRDPQQVVNITVPDRWFTRVSTECMTKAGYDTNEYRFEEMRVMGNGRLVEYIFLRADSDTHLAVLARRDYIGRTHEMEAQYFQDGKLLTTKRFAPDQPLVDEGIITLYGVYRKRESMIPENTRVISGLHSFFYINHDRLESMGEMYTLPIPLILNPNRKVEEIKLEERERIWPMATATMLGVRDVQAATTTRRIVEKYR